MTDLDIIRQIEQELGVKLEKTDRIEWYRQSYSLNKNGQVTGLDLSMREIGSLKRIISPLKELENLTALDLSYNNIKDISFLGEIEQLQYLNLTENKIRDISFLKNLGQLQVLNLSGNEISDISLLKDLNQLQSINLAFNQIGDHSFLKNLRQLKELNLGVNGISDYSFLRNLVQLHYLNLTFNEISDISSLKALVQLQSLVLRSNVISDISSLKALVQLQSLDLRSNVISDISSLKALVQLQSLDLDENEISDISPLKNLKELIHLKLQNNPIEKLPSWITNFNMEIEWRPHGSKGIIFYDNPLKTPPPEIVKQGKEAIKDYFKSLKGKTVKLNEVKLLFVGEGMAGKTSLLKRLQGMGFDEHESQTHGINVVSLSSDEITGFGLKECRLNCWDFGGQEIMHASHRFFMSKRSLYILILDSRTDAKKYHWLKHIEKYGGDSPVIVVMNKIDENPNYNIEQNKINKTFPNIRNRFHRISCKTGEDMKQLVKSISKAIPETSLFGSDISADWMNIKNRLVKETKENQYISRQRFIEICEENNVHDESSQQTLLTYLHDLGIVLYFKQLALANIYVLDPHWVTIGVYKIICSQKIENGFLKEDDLDYILNKEQIKTEEYDPAKEKDIFYTPEEQLYILNIMKQFKLCYEYGRGTNYYIIPDNLPKELENEPELNTTPLLCFIMEYDYLPSSVISRLMIRLQKDIVDGQQWRFGMILENSEGCKAKIKADEQAKAISITVQGDFFRKREYFSVIRHHIRDINSDFENLGVKEAIPLPGHPDMHIEYQELLGYEKAGRDEYFVGKLGEIFSVSEMLDSVISREERAKESRGGDHIHIEAGGDVSFGKGRAAAKSIKKHETAKGKSMGDVNINVNPNFENIGNPKQTQNAGQQQTSDQQAKQASSQQQTTEVTQTQQVRQDAKTIQSLFKNLKEDIIDEADIEIEDEKEKKRLKKELQKTENALTELEKAASENKKEIDESVKSRLEEFVQSLANEDSRISKALRFVSQGKEKVQKIAKTYNNLAPFFALPSIPPALIGNEE